MQFAVASEQALHLTPEARELTGCVLETRRGSCWWQHQDRTWAANGQRQPQEYGLQSVEQRPQLVTEVRELCTEVHQRCQFDNVLPASPSLLPSAAAVAVAGNEEVVLQTGAGRRVRGVELPELVDDEGWAARRTGDHRTGVIRPGRRLGGSLGPPVDSLRGEGRGGPAAVEVLAADSPASQDTSGYGLVAAT